MYNKEYPTELFDELQHRTDITKEDLNFIKDGDLEIIARETDFLGVNYYSRGVIRDEEINEDENMPKNVEMGPNTDFGWEVYPPGIYDLLMQLKTKYGVGTIYITENGCSYSDGPDEENKIHDQRRIDYHHTHLIEIQKAINNGVDCRGYFAWSLMDNFEWAQVFSQRFGLVWVDFDSLKRIPKESYHWYKNYISNNK